MLNKFWFAIGQGLDAHEIRDDVGVDLRNLTRRAYQDSGSDDLRRLRRHVTDLRGKVETRKREGAITPHRAAELNLILGQAGI
ncbi:hypothetical protein ACGFNU_49100 [Spirillospora sp. NPDC048911]|uniref:hypothetical protein n=1 Tax=Spirillospora sp. NPDC048911 TaxID=3364527 RepID=UPI00371D4330